LEDGDGRFSGIGDDIFFSAEIPVPDWSGTRS
jgi:hypothetical protein